MTPAGQPDATGNVPAIGGFCFQDVGIARAGQGNADPSLNVDVNRNGIEPDIAFTGANDSVPWVVWYETGPGPGLASNEMVFAAKAESDTGRRARWLPLARHRQQRERDPQRRPPRCAASAAAEQACSLNSSPGGGRRGPAGRRRDDEPGQPDRSWVTWDETVGGVTQVFVSRFVATPTPHFQIVNGGQPISTPGVDSTRAGHHVLGQHAVRDVA